MKVMSSTFNQSKSARINFLVTVLLFLSILLGCKALTSQAKGKMSNLRCESTTRIVKGEFDYGINVIVTVKNVGESGVINVTAELSTSEGEWEREQNINFNAGESKTLTYFFDEPTFNVDNPQCGAAVFPKAN